MTDPNRTSKPVTFLRLGYAAIHQRPQGEVYLLESEVMAEIERLTEAFLKYSWHKRRCAYIEQEGRAECSCGVVDVIKYTHSADFRHSENETCADAKLPGQT